jgi:hypothetical protein
MGVIKYRNLLPATDRLQAKQALHLAHLIDDKRLLSGFRREENDIRVCPRNNCSTGRTYATPFARFLTTQYSLGKRERGLSFADTYWSDEEIGMREPVPVECVSQRGKGGFLAMDIREGHRSTLKRKE